MSRVASPDHIHAAGQLRKYIAKHQEIELLLQLGEYKPGADADADFAVARIESMRQLLRQPPTYLSSFDEALDGLRRLFG